MELLEREAVLQAVDAALADAREGRGRVVVVAGEAGVGKTALLTALAERHAGLRVLVGACDPLTTPRALGPFHDIARQAGGRLAEAMRAARREDVVAAALDELSAAPPRVMVVEDAHWADEGTLDLVALLGRRVGATTGALLVTLRPGEAGDRLRGALGELPPAVVRRIDLDPLSPAGVAELARRAGRGAQGLHDATGGNPFFVTEVLASGDELPATVRDAVLARARRLSPAGRRALEVVSVVPGRAELWLVQAVLGAASEAVDECLRRGMIELDGAALRFRHEIARSSIAGELSPMRRQDLERRVLGALAGRPDVDPARRVHHARRAGDDAAVLATAPDAARVASAGGAHAQAAEHYRAALAAAGSAEPSRHAELLEGLSFEAYLSGSATEALATRREALAIRTRLGQPDRAGENERWLSRLLWWEGRREDAEAAAARAVALLEPLGASSALAMAYSTLSQLLMLAWRREETVTWGERAIALARRLGDRDTLAHALTNVGTVLAAAGEAEGFRMLREAADTAHADGQHDHAVRALVNLSWNLVLQRRYAEAAETIERGLAFARANDLRSYDQYLHGIRAWVRLDTGDWTGAEEDARAVMALDATQPAISSHPGMVALGRLLARRGDPHGRDLLATAWDRAVVADEPQRLLPAAHASAELAWLTGDAEGLRRFADHGVAVSQAPSPRLIGETQFWLWRAGGAADAAAAGDDPHGLSIRGEHRAAARAWEALGCPYEAADALSESDDVDDLLRALAAFDRLGAALPAARLRARLRGDGRAVPAGPRAATRSDPDGLTIRQREILDLVAAGETNGAIAARLVLSPRTVDHHVSAVLRKLGVATRAEAAARAAAARRVAEDGRVHGRT